MQFVVNFEEGGENNILHGDRASEAFLSDVLGAQPWPGQRHANIESMFEYGSRAGFWRLWRMFTERKLPATVFGVATALQRNPEVVAAMKEAGWDIASHSLKWIEHKDMSEAEERAEIAEAIRVHTEATGARPLGWYTGRSSINTLRLVMEAGGFFISATPMPTICHTGSGRAGRSRIWSFPIRSMPTTCVLSTRRALAAARSSSPISRTVLTSFTPKARPRRR